MKARTRLYCGLILVVLLLAGSVSAARLDDIAHRSTITAYFANSKGIYAGDEVRIQGVPVGKIDRIDTMDGRAKITFWFDNRYPVPADVDAVIISPTLISARAIQLTPAYTGGPTLRSGEVLGQDRTAVPVEWDDFRVQLDKITAALQPGSDGLSSAGQFINTAADNLRGNGQAIRAALLELSQATSALGDHSGDIFNSVRNLATLVSALRGSSDILEQLNTNLAAVTTLLTNAPDEIGDAVTTLNTATADISGFVAANREALGTTVDKTTAITTAINASIYDVKQILHITPTLLANYVNIYQPAQGALTGALAFNNFDNPINFVCGAIQAASRLDAEQAAKLCVQYLAPIVKNRQYNFPPLGFNPFVGAVARPNEITYSEDRLRPDAPAVAPPTAPPALAAEAPLPASTDTPNPVEELPPIQTDPSAGLPGLMTPPMGHP